MENMVKQNGGNQMSSIINNDKLKEFVTTQSVIQKGNIQNCKGMKYDFTLSGRFLKAKSKRPLNYNELSVADKEAYAVIKPGEVIYVLAEETVSMPQDVYAQLTPKRSMGEIGINVQGALFIDPKYEGVLVFGLYNYSSTDFHFTPGKTFASAVFYQLDENEAFEYITGKEPKKIYDFSPELINTISKYEPVGFHNLANRMENVESDIKDIKYRLDDNDRWAREVKNILNQVSDQNRANTSNIKSIQQNINDLNNALTAEMNNRKQEDLILNEKVIKSEQKTKILSSLTGILLFILGSGVTVFVSWIAGFFK